MCSNVAKSVRWDQSNQKDFIEKNRNKTNFWTNEEKTVCFLKKKHIKSNKIKNLAVRWIHLTPHELTRIKGKSITTITPTVYLFYTFRLYQIFLFVYLWVTRGITPRDNDKGFTYPDVPIKRNNHNVRFIWNLGSRPTLLESVHYWIRYICVN